jgi:exonuclease VII small subunit
MNQSATETPERILVNKNLPEQSALKTAVQVRFKELSRLNQAYKNAWDGYPNVTDNLLSFTMADTRQALRTKAMGVNCPSCHSRGVLHYGNAISYLLDRLLDEKINTSSVGGLELDRDELKNLVKKLDFDKAQQLQKAMYQWENSAWRYRGADEFLNIQEGRVVVLQDELEQALKEMEVYIDDAEDIELLRDIERLLEMRTSINEKLAKKGKKAIALSEQYEKPGHILLYGTGESGQKRYVIQKDNLFS